MTSRSWVLALVGLTLAIGVGWGAYELRREGGVDAPPDTTSARISEAAITAPGSAPAEASATATAPAIAEEAADQGASDRDPASEPTASVPSTLTTPPGEPLDVAALEAPEPAEPAPPEPAVPAAASPAPIAEEATAVSRGGSIDQPARAAEPGVVAPAGTLGSSRASQIPLATDARPDETTAAGQTEPTEPTPQPEGQPLSEVAASDQSDPADPSEIEPAAAPSFDIVRIRPGGAAVLAGRATPDAEVELRSGDRVIDRVRANRRGEWVAVPQEPLPAGDQQLTLAARVGDRPAVESDEVLVIAVPEPPPPQQAPRAAAEAPPPQPPEIAAAGSPGEPLAVALPRSERGQGRILQAPGRISGDGTLALMVLDYDTTGRIRLRGEASPGSPVLIYVDNEPAGAAVVEPSGQWSTVLEPALAPGDYTLRLDQLGPSGKPTARLETPFTRASQPPVEGDVQVDFVIVQPGNSLWRIARRVFGQGLHYVHIYDANQKQIRDPDLIYPGQVFEIPAGIDPAG